LDTWEVGDVKKGRAGGGGGVPKAEGKNPSWRRDDFAGKGPRSHYLESWPRGEPVSEEEEKGYEVIKTRGTEQTFKSVLRLWRKEF